jgi:GAF domain-containing protein
MTQIKVLVAVPLVSSVRYRESLSQEQRFNLQIVTSLDKTREAMAGGSQPDVLVLDCQLGDIYGLVTELRQAYPGLLIIQVDEDADFSLPGQADDVSNNPFKEDELLWKIKRLVEDRRLETLRADALPTVRSFAKALMRAKGGPAKTQAAVTAIQELGYDYVAFFKLTPTDPPSVSVVAQAGSKSVVSVAPAKLDYEKSLIGWCFQSGQSRVVGPEDNPNHPFISRRRFGAGVCIPVGTNLRFGVVFASQEIPGSISEENVLLLELICAQLASALARESGN